MAVSLHGCRLLMGKKVVGMRGENSARLPKTFTEEEGPGYRMSYLKYLKHLHMIHRGSLVDFHPSVLLCDDQDS